MEIPTPGSAPEAVDAVTGAMPPPQSRAVPYWHTALLLLVLGVFSVLNAMSGHGARSGHSRVGIYLSTMIYEWLLTGYVWWGLRRSGLTLRGLIGGRWHGAGDFFRDIATAAGVWLGALLALYMLAAVAELATGVTHADKVNELNDTLKRIGFLAPQGLQEAGLWLCVSATAGFCEEVLFRGYLQMQFTRWLRNRWSALAVVSVLFGLGHAYEGLLSMMKIVVLGLAFGLVSLGRKSLRPAMMAHTWQDAITGLALWALKKMPPRMA